jgi:O-antigen/teichoic acid export membrane protein
MTNNKVRTIWGSICNTANKIIRFVTRDKLAINAGFILGKNIITSLGGFLFWTIAAFYYSSAQIGVNSSIISISMLLANLASLGFGAGLLRFAPEFKNTKGLFPSVLIIQFISLLLFGVGYLVLLPVLSPTLTTSFINFGSKLIFVILIILLESSGMMSSFFIAYREAKYSFYAIIIMSVVRLAMIFILRDLFIMGIILATIIGHSVSIIIGLLSFYPNVFPDYKFKFTFPKGKLMEVFTFTIGNFIAFLFRQTPGWVVVPITLEKLGAESSAHVFFAWMISGFISSPAIAFGNSSLVESTHSPESIKKILKRTLIYSLGITIPLVIFFILTSNILLSLFGEDVTKNSRDLLIWLAVASPFTVINSVILTYLQMKKMMKSMLISSGFIILVTLCYIYLMILKFGILSVGYGWIISNVLASVYLLYIYWKSAGTETEKTIPNNKVLE